MRRLVWLRERHGHASAERAVCGQGLADIHRAVQEIDGARGGIDIGGGMVPRLGTAG